MLHNVKINAKRFTEIAKQGSHINIVLAAGEIVARIKYRSGQVEQTKLISGMAFETREQFISVAVSSEVDQQTRIWLSDLPLTYSPENARLVGSAAVKSESKSVYYGEAKEFLPAETGRGKITINPSADIYIGGVGLNIQNAIKIPANSVYELSTQGALFAYSMEQSHKAVTLVNTDNGMNFDSIVSGVSGKSVAVSVEDDIYITAGDGAIRRHRLSDDVMLGTVSFSGNMIDDLNSSKESLQVSNGKVYFCTQTTGSVRLYELGFDGSISHTELIAAGYNASVYDWAIDFDNQLVYILARKNANAPVLFYGDFTSVTEYAVPDFGTYDANSVNVVSNDGLRVRISGLRNYIESTDGGATWSAVQSTPFDVSYHSGYQYDKISGYFYLLANNNVLHRAIDIDGSYTPVKTFGSNVGRLIFAAGQIYATNESHFYHSKDSGNNWQESDIDTESGVNVNGLTGIGIGSGGVVRVMAYYNNSIVKLSGQEEIAGGLSVAVMSEVN